MKQLIWIPLITATFLALAHPCKAEDLEGRAYSLAYLHWIREKYHDDTEMMEQTVRHELNLPMLKLLNLDSDHVQAFFDGGRVYRVKVFNMRSVVAGRPWFDYAIMLTGKDPLYIESDSDAAKAISLRKKPIASVDDVVQRLLVFADLRAYKIGVRSLTLEDPREIRALMKKGKPIKPEKLDADNPAHWNWTIWEEKEKWIVGCVLMTDTNIEALERFILVFNANGGMTVEYRKLLVSSGGYL
ncbi:MAG: hypothetical protein JXR37_26025 [Kiritimatiellae bacterium]|nr:hypothetical protein [Kiritimatiellia bacterium]